MKFFAVILCAFAFLVIIYFSFFEQDKKEWVMPKELNEISGISFVDENLLACVQDEKGTIYLFDLERNLITKRIKFSGKGDYEAIAIKGQTAYVLTGDGTLYEVNDFMDQPAVNTFDLNLSENLESEAMCYDLKGNRLLIAFKNSKNDDSEPGLFSFDLNTKTFNDTIPALAIDLSLAPVKRKDRENIKKTWQPADIAFHKDINRIYVIDAINLHFMELDMEGKLISMEEISNKKMDHPEGIAVSSDGKIYICNDANKAGKGKILKLRN
jgi:uncharacterized protein YjiK